MRFPFIRLLPVALLLLAAACGGPAPVAPGPAPVAAAPGAVGTILRVALFPYLPDVARDTLRTLQARIEQEFEALNPGIDLQMRRMDPSDNDFYAPDSLRLWLTASVADSGYHVVEVDAIMLGDLAAAGVLTPWAAVDSSNWNTAVLPALTYAGVLYGIPHWLCGDFILTRDTAVHNAGTIEAFTSALTNASSRQVKLSGALRGSWTLPALYLHTYADVYDPSGMAAAITAPVDTNTAMAMRSVLDFCRLNDGTNTCLDSLYTADSSVAIYASGRSDAFLGFSERLTAILMAGADGSQIRLSPAPLGPIPGPGSLPVIYVDALVLNKGCDSACQGAATAFSAYLLSDSTYQWLLTSGDVPTSTPVPRYLLPATRSAFTVPGVSNDVHFQDMRAAIRGGVPLPNQNFAANRKALQAALLGILNPN